MKKTRYYKELNDNAVQCQLCNHFCIIKENRVGLCRVRKNKRSALYSLVYNYPSTLNVDSIEKKSLYHFMPGQATFSMGTYGCNFKCADCNNWEISQVKEIEKKLEEADLHSPDRIIEQALSNGCLSIAYSHNEPTVFTEYIIDTMKLAHECELKNVWLSNGYMSDLCLNEILPYLDAININLKSMDGSFYRKFYKAKLEAILKNLKLFKTEQIHLEVTTLVIPGVTDKLSNFEEISQFIAMELGTDTPWHVSKFFPEESWKMKDYRETGDDIIYEACEIGREAGLKYVYNSDTPDERWQDTFCPRCQELAIKRSVNLIERFDSYGRCAHCDKDLDIIE